MPVPSDPSVFTDAVVHDFPFDAVEAATRIAESEPQLDVEPSLPPIPPPAAVEPEPEEETLPEFDPRYREAFSGLLYLGDLRDTFAWGGHSITIRTIHPDEYKAVAALHAKHAGTIGDVRAYADAIVAACVVSVDGQQLPIPSMGPATTVERVSAAYEYISSHWYAWTIDAIYDRFRVLEEQVEQVLAAMGKASG